MKVRKGTPDIMGNLMSGSIADNKTVEHENNKTIKPDVEIAVKPESNKASKVVDRKAIKQVSNKTIRPASNQAAMQESMNDIQPENQQAIKDAPKEKVTFNLSLQTIERLDDAWIQLRKQFRDQQRVTKTFIVEQALEIILNDLSVKGDSSLILKKIYGEQEG